MENVGWYFLGVLTSVAGLAIFKFIENWWEYSNKVKFLKKELSINLKLIEGFQKTSKKYRQALNESRLNNFYGYFQFMNFGYSIINDMYVKGELYKAINEEQISKLKNMASYYGAVNQNDVFNRMANIKDTNNFRNGLNLLDTLEFTFGRDVQALKEIISSLK